MSDESLRYVSAPQRREWILAAVRTAGFLSVADLARELGVSDMTVRRDLDVLEERGALRRVHGGAVAMSKGSIAEPSVADREGRAREAKLRIARAAMRMLPPAFAGSVLLDAGTTTAALARLLAEERAPAAAA